jgi:hypothetical protein
MPKYISNEFWDRYIPKEKTGQVRVLMGCPVCKHPARVTIFRPYCSGICYEKDKNDGKISRVY